MSGDLFDRLLVPFVVTKERLFNLYSNGWFGFANPDVAEPHWITMVLQANRQLVGMLFVLRRTVVRGITFQLEMVQDQNAVMQGGDIRR